MKSIVAVFCLAIPFGAFAAPPCADAARAKQAGFEPAALCAVMAEFAGTATNFHALVIERHGVVVAQAYRRGKDASIYTPIALPHDFDERTQHDVRSISKSITSLLWGIAAGEGKVPALSTPVLDLLPAQRQLRRDGR